MPVVKRIKKFLFYKTAKVKFVYRRKKLTIPLNIIREILI